MHGVNCLPTVVTGHRNIERIQRLKQEETSKDLNFRQRRNFTVAITELVEGSCTSDFLSSYENINNLMTESHVTSKRSVEVVQMYSLGALFAAIGDPKFGTRNSMLTMEFDAHFKCPGHKQPASYQNLPRHLRAYTRWAIGLLEHYNKLYVADCIAKNKAPADKN
jgi:hypothetical protein